MTVGIGALCRAGNCLIFGADTKGTYKDPNIPDTQIGKQFDFLPYAHLCANIAGDVHVCTSVVSELTAQIQALQKEPMVYHDHVRNAIREAQLQELLYRVDYELTKRLGMRLTEWKQMNTTSLAYRRGAKLIKRSDLPVQFTVGGFVKGSAVLLETNYSDPPEMVHVSSIGTGGSIAADHLDSRNQDANTSVQRTLLHVAEAMERARADQYVGEPSDYTVLTHRTYRRFPARDPFLSQMLLRYFEKPTDPLDDTEEALSKFRSALYFPGTTKDEYAAGLRHPTGKGLRTARKLKERDDADWLVTELDDGRRVFSLPRTLTQPV